MPQVHRPDQPEQLIELIQWAAGSSTPLEVLGGGSKAGIGLPLATEHLIQLSGFSGVSDYDPVELVLTAGAGTPLQEIKDLLAEQNQILAFEPPDYSSLFGISSSTKNGNGTDDNSRPIPGGTLGGTLAGNISGPRRFFAGAARDHFLGFKAVSGRGEPFKSGGRVVKNVTGFDLSKLMAGSWGTLAVLWQVTVKVLPAPEKTRTLLLLGLNPEQAKQVMIGAAASAHSISGAAHLAHALASQSSVSYVNSVDSGVTALRVEGPAASVDYRLEALRKLFLNENFQLEELHSKNSKTLWQEIANLSLFKGSPLDSNDRDPQDNIWRLSLPPATSWQALSQLLELGVKRWMFDQAGGALWLACPNSISGVQIRNTLSQHDGHATLWRSDHSTEQTLPIFQPQSAPVAALSQRVKNSFDPVGILNPGRMYQEL
jgi:glycolate oxidase FAD binding subunit